MTRESKRPGTGNQGQKDDPEAPDGEGPQALAAAGADETAAERAQRNKDEQARIAARLALAQAEQAYELALLDVEALQEKLDSDVPEVAISAAATAKVADVEERTATANGTKEVTAGEVTAARQNASDMAEAARIATANLEAANTRLEDALTADTAIDKELTALTDEAAKSKADAKAALAAKDTAEQLAKIKKPALQAAIDMQKNKVEGAWADAQLANETALADLARAIACRSAGDA